MFDVNLNFDDVSISSIMKEDIKLIEHLLSSQKCCIDLSTQLTIDRDELYQRFLEYYMNECEFFLKINKAGNLSGILKGRIEFKNPNEVWIWYFLLDDDLKSKDLENRVIDNIMLYFNKVYGIRDFFTGVQNKSENIIRFWKDNGFKVIRVSQDFYDKNDGYADMLILKRNL